MLPVTAAQGRMRNEACVNLPAKYLNKIAHHSIWTSPLSVRKVLVENLLNE